MRIEYVWAVYCKETEQDYGQITDVFSDEGLATEFAKGKGHWGRDARVDKVRAFIDKNGKMAHVIDVSLVLNDGKAKEDLKAKALAKLSEEEKKVLGLSCGK